MQCDNMNHQPQDTASVTCQCFSDQHVVVALQSFCLHISTKISMQRLFGMINKFPSNTGSCFKERRLTVHRCVSQVRPLFPLS